MNSFDENKKIIEERKRLQAEKARQLAAAELIEKIRISINTTMVGALTAMEENMGHLWGHGSGRSTAEQDRNYELWQNVRQDILDRGNAALEKAKYHAGRFIIEHNDDKKFKYNLKFKKD